MFKGMSNIYKQAQQMQKKMQKVQDDLLNLEINGQSGGGMVKIVVNGKKDIISINIDDSVLAEDKEMVEDLVLSAIKQAMENAEKKSQDMMKSATGGMMPNIPGF